jgi:hypothetical protein
MTLAWDGDEAVTVTIENDGRVEMIDSAIARAVASALGVTTVRRASHVIPANRVLRYLFNVIRTHWDDDSRLAAFTRRWPCLWLVDATPIGGDVLPGRWRDRQAAIDAEIEHVNDIFLNR